MKKIALLLSLLFAGPAQAQTLPGPPFTCQTTCTAAMTLSGSLPAAPFSCQVVCAENPAFNTPTLPGAPFNCNVACSAPSTPATLPGSPFSCQQVCTAPVVVVVFPPPGSPVVTSAPLTVPTPVAFDELIGTVAVSNPPITAMTIVSGDPGNPTLSPPGYFNIYAATLHLRTSGVTGAALPPAGVYNLMVNATNAAGTGAAALITVTVP